MNWFKQLFSRRASGRPFAVGNVGAAPFGFKGAGFDFAFFSLVARPPQPFNPPGAPFMRSMSGDFLFTIFLLPFSDFLVFFAFPSHQPAAAFSSRSSVSGYRRTSRTSAAA